MVMIDSIVRLIPGVIEEKSLENESFNDDLLDYPVYTKPKIIKEWKYQMYYLVVIMKI